MFDGLAPRRDCFARAVEPDPAQPRGGGSKRVGLELVTDVDRRASWHSETTAGQLKNSRIGLGHAKVVRGQHHVDVPAKACSGDLLLLLPLIPVGQNRNLGHT